MGRNLETLLKTLVVVALLATGYWLGRMHSVEVSLIPVTPSNASNADQSDNPPSSVSGPQTSISETSTEKNSISQSNRPGTTTSMGSDQLKAIENYLRSLPLESVVDFLEKEKAAIYTEDFESLLLPLPMGNQIESYRSSIFDELIFSYQQSPYWVGQFFIQTPDKLYRSTALFELYSSQPALGAQISSQEELCYSLTIWFSEEKPEESVAGMSGCLASIRRDLTEAIITNVDTSHAKALRKDFILVALNLPSQKTNTSEVRYLTGKRQWKSEGQFDWKPIDLESRNQILKKFSWQ